MTSKTIIEAKNISKHFERKIAISSLSFSILQGEKVALIGPSGAGKTTLLNSIAGLVPIQNGELSIDSKLISSYKKGHIFAKKVGVIRQQFDLIGSIPVIHNVLAGRLAEWGLFKSLLSLLVPQEKEIALKALERVGLTDKMYEITSTLSGGEQQRVAMARLMVQKPEVILADEPVASLDPARAEDVLAMLIKIVSEEKQTLIASLHSVEYARKYFTRIIALKNGEMLFDLPTEKVTDELLANLYRLKEQG
ncbi:MULTISPECIES: phosphonate ABC transporter ATP-binding protein [unclassified Bacillus (in: firmicutes)]|uniref:phosphonate ABC transporter ATP-binding protein n=1 Tax=unclassified Bacillus (in: firmicutes) TaxID=185979 RepID=UPI001BEC7597|nr:MULTISPECIES: ATP-binding cassette domain-containing protein [unclassified Bacillus (in: firmicutes)]MBT2725112.1 ATP-binding cassette domain-containing protein [Bacillus sp. ISL-46]MBT2744415.1 ATP-binding cassette domain-containing protein [Bacillus sp. ISL-77]